MAGATIRFDGLNLVARDLPATIDFYRRLGLDIPDEAVWSTGSGPHHVSNLDTGSDLDLDLDSEALARRYNAGFAADPDPTRTVLGFRVDVREDVDRVHDDLVAAGHRSRQTPYDAFWGARYAIVADPDGRDVGIMGPIDPARRSPGPDL